MAETRKKTSLSITEDADALWTALAEHFGLFKSQVFEMLIRDKARAEGLLPLVPYVEKGNDDGES